MSKLNTILPTAAIIAAVAAPATAGARPIVPVAPQTRTAPARNLTAPPTPPGAQVIVRQAPESFDWADAAAGAGATLLVIGAAGVGAAGLRTRRRVRPQVIAS